ncbi:RNA methyltransferase [Virgibacillus sp. YIM 98842]|uniref:TrmH family RNA methyltransferase n=1 Tax=Virgibacillus sp. YIM 98842 TaxID=2663533 RepID=UPI0013DC5154|nr:RNA methyltransferase [Virgibacillus sp. YIM 98842]
MITSLKNEKVKNWKKLHKRKTRMENQTFLIEGFHLLEEAFNSCWIIKEVIIQHTVALPDWCNRLPVVEVSEQVFRQISRTESPQGIAAVVAMKEVQKIEGNQILLIDAVQDPGNLGTMIRTADACGFAGIIAGLDTVDIYNDKVIRATQGSLFHIPVYQQELKDEIIRLKKKKFQVWATALQGAEQFNFVPVPEKTALIVGNEGAGVRESLLAAADKTVRIPIYGKAESLNVSVAAGILMYYLKQ